jgi:uncharacterized integral membrane protein (TIGR00697 family)
MKQYRFVAPITGLFTAILLISNTLDNKIFQAGPLSLPAGIILFPLAYLANDVLTEVYGFAVSRKVIWTGFASLILMVAMYELAGLLPPAPFWTNQAAYKAVLKHTPRIVLAGITAYFFGEFCNSYVLAKLKVRSAGRGMALRFVASTVVGEFVDTVIFVVIAFLGVFPAAGLVSITLSAWAVKVCWEIIALPITLPVVRRLKRAENEDYFDHDTKFSPFIFDQPRHG